MAHDALVRRTIDSVLVGQGTLIDTDLTAESSHLPQEGSRIRAKNRAAVVFILTKIIHEKDYNQNMKLKSFCL